MNKRLETLLDRIPTWPEEAQDWAAIALAEVEEKVRVLQALTPLERAKLDALRTTISQSVAQGGSFTDEEVAANVEVSLDAWENKRKGAREAQETAR
jgi:hypothetical protein